MGRMSDRVIEEAENAGDEIQCSIDILERAIADLTKQSGDFTSDDIDDAINGIRDMMSDLRAAAETVSDRVTGRAA